MTANIHANFSLPAVLREIAILNMGNSQKKPIIAKSINAEKPELSILNSF
jgi:hypothetical protein